MTSCYHMCNHSCNGSQEPFFNKTMLGLTRQECHKTVSALLLPFLGLPDPQICSNRAYMGLFLTARWTSHVERTRGKVTANMERNISRHHIQNVYASMPIVSHRAFAL
ncbi:uncharacterized protein TNCV_610411 [Trichonephila clavipes]|nr:uncharacterized protein TNCV_610411 [Trichonephila clavipes]